MRHIRKGAAPACLAEWRDARSSFDDIPGGCKDKMRAALVREQYGICCYCGARIRGVGKDGEPTDKLMKIEHWLPQSDPTDGDAHSMLWSNMLGACPGEKANPPRGKASLHCDSSKGNTPITIDPRLARVDEDVIYSVTGEVSSHDPAIEADLTNTLNLNLPILVRNRKAALDGFLAAMRLRHGSGDWGDAPTKERAKLLNPVVGSELPEFAPMLAYRLGKRIGSR